MRQSKNYQKRIKCKKDSRKKYNQILNGDCVIVILDTSLDTEKIENMLDSRNIYIFLLTYLSALKSEWCQLIGILIYFIMQQTFISRCVKSVSRIK